MAPYLRLVKQHHDNWIQSPGAVIGTMGIITSLYISSTKNYNNIKDLKENTRKKDVKNSHQQAYQKWAGG
jgi:hypothetical protein